MTRPAPDSRTAPPCRHFGTCGGCTALDIPIDAQLERKRNDVAALLAPWLGSAPVDCTPPPRVPVHTRTKLSWPIQPDPRDGLVLGMYERGSHRAVAIEQCRIQDPALTRIARRARDVLRASGLAAYDERDGSGFLRAFHARLMAGSGELLVGVTTRGGEFTGAARLAAALGQAAAGLRDARGRPVRLVGVVRSIHDPPGNALLGRHHVPLRGRDYQTDRIGDLAIRVGFGSFYQSHRNADAVLFVPALAMLGPVAGMRVVDAYGGVGAFALRLARAGAAQVELVEAHAGAARDAAANATSNGLSAVRVVAAPFAAATLDPAPDLCIVDPPRAGLGPDGVARVVALRPARLLYVSCGPRALARDLAELTAAGFRVTACRVCDLFPHTEHVETLCLLDGPGAAAPCDGRPQRVAGS